MQAKLQFLSKVSSVNFSQTFFLPKLSFRIFLLQSGSLEFSQPTIAIPAMSTHFSLSGASSSNFLSDELLLDIYLFLRSSNFLLSSHLKKFLVEGPILEISSREHCNALRNEQPLL